MSGRVLEVYSNQPGMQFYTGNLLPDPDKIVEVRFCILSLGDKTILNVFIVLCNLVCVLHISRFFVSLYTFFITESNFVCDLKNEPSQGFND